MSEKFTKIGVGALIIRDNLGMFTKRKGSHGEGLWGTVGGHLEYGETPEQTIEREALEELGIKITNLKHLCTASFTIEGKHYIDISFTAEIAAGEPTPLEPDKIEVVEWFDLDHPPKNLFPPVLFCLEARRTGVNYFVNHEEA